MPSLSGPGEKPSPAFPTISSRSRQINSGYVPGLSICGSSGDTLYGYPDRVDQVEVAEEREFLDSLDELLRWVTMHVSDLRESVAGARRLQQIELIVLKRLQEYRERVQKSLRERSAPRTWEHADTLFLP